MSLVWLHWLGSSTSNYKLNDVYSSIWRVPCRQFYEWGDAAASLHLHPCVYLLLLPLLPRLRHYAPNILVVIHQRHKEYVSSPVTCQVKSITMSCRHGIVHKLEHTQTFDKTKAIVMAIVDGW
jgi:hypothetical protein